MTNCDELTGSLINALRSRVAQSVTAQHSQRVVCLCAGRHELLNVLSDGEVVANDQAQHLQAAAAHNSWQWCRLKSMPSPPPADCEYNFARLVTI